MKYPLLLLFTTILFFSVTSFVLAVEPSEKPSLETLNNTNLDDVYSSAPALRATKEVSIYTVLGRVITVIISIAGFLSLVLILRSGLQIMTAGGDANKVGEAKKRLIYLVIGLVVLVASGILSNFILALVSGAVAT